MAPAVSGLAAQEAGVGGREEGETAIFPPGSPQPTVGLYWRTLRHLRGGQLYHLLRQRLRRAVGLRPRLASLSEVRLREISAPVAFPDWNREAAVAMLETRAFAFLNLRASPASSIPWNDARFPKLWLYHLNYCDFLNVTLRADENRALLRKALAIMLEWIEANGRGDEVGWEPYPLSLRIVNWLKFLAKNREALSELEYSEEVSRILQSLVSQTEFLYRNPELHLLGNHLLKNGKALLFAGGLVETDRSEEWWQKGSRILAQEVREQFLSDGGHCERSPMYHALAVEDLADLLLLSRLLARPLPCEGEVRGLLPRAAAFLQAMTHPDGDLALFNDCAFGIARKPAELQAYLAPWVPPSPSAPRLACFGVTGYAVARESEGGNFLVFDCGPLGPDYQPGHGHCDLLSYELSVDGSRLVVDSGVSTYEPGAERYYLRSTAAHNTVVLDGQEQAEIWASFRVGGRPAVRYLEASQESGVVHLRGEYRGYGCPAVAHRRQVFAVFPKTFVVVDQLMGAGSHTATGYLHLHPEVCVERCATQAGAGSGTLGPEFSLRLWGRVYYLYVWDVATLDVTEGWYFPEFGVRIRTNVICWSWRGGLPACFGHAIVPGEEAGPQLRLHRENDSIEVGRLNLFYAG
jgi:hypothetical protein